MYLDEVSSLQPGMELDRFTVSSFIGKGGLGEVYEVVDEADSSVHAVKVMPKASLETDDPEFREILLKSLQEIKDPFLLPLHDFGDEEVFFWMRSDFVAPHEAFRARTVWEYARRFQGRLPESMVRGIIAQTLRALHSLHEAGIAHANLKPENLLFAADGSIRLSDAGHVLTVGHSWDDFHLPKDGTLQNATPFDPLPGFSRALPSLLRTFEYFAPEREEGRTAGDPICDIYSVGLITYHLLTGRTRPILRKPASQIIPEINPAWDAWIQRATAYEREERFHTVAEMARDLPESTGRADSMIEEGFISESKVFYAPKPRSLIYDPEPDFNNTGTPTEHGNPKSHLTLSKPKPRADSPPPSPNPTTPGVAPASATAAVQTATDDRRASINAIADTVDVIAGGPTRPDGFGTAPIPAGISALPAPDPGEIHIPDSKLGFFLKFGALAALLVASGFAAAYFILNPSSAPQESTLGSPAAETAPAIAEPKPEIPVLTGRVTLFTYRGGDFIVQIRPENRPKEEVTLQVTATFFESLRVGQTVQVFERHLAPGSPRTF